MNRNHFCFYKTYTEKCIQFWCFFLWQSHINALIITEYTYSKLEIDISWTSRVGCNIEEILIRCKVWGYHTGIKEYLIVQDIRPCNLVKKCRYFVSGCCLHLQSNRIVCNLQRRIDSWKRRKILSSQHRVIFHKHCVFTFGLYSQYFPPCSL